MHGRLVVAEREGDRAVDQLDVGIRVRSLDRVDASADRIRDHHIACTLGTHNTEADNRRAINASERSRLGNGVADEAEIVQSYLASRRQRDPCCREIGYGLCPCERTNRLVASANLGPPAGEVDGAPAELPADIERSEPEALQANRVEADPYLTFHATDTLHSSHPAHPLQLADDHILHEPGDLLGCLPRRDRGIGEDREASDVDALDQRLIDGTWQIGADPRDRVLDVVESAIGVSFEPKRDGCYRQSIRDRGIDLLRTFDPGDSVLDRLGNLRFELGRRGAELRDDHGHDRNIGLRHARDRQLIETEISERDHCERYDKWRKRLSYRPRRDVHSHPLSLRSRSAINDRLA